MIIPAVYEQIQTGEGIFGIIAEGKARFLEVYEDLYGFSDGVALVKQNGNWFYIDKKGKRLF